MKQVNCQKCSPYKRMWLDLMLNPTYSSSRGCANCTMSLAILNKAARTMLSQNTLVSALTRLGVFLLGFLCVSENSTLVGSPSFVITSGVKVGYPDDNTSPCLEKKDSSLSTIESAFPHFLLQRVLWIKFIKIDAKYVQWQLVLHVQNR